MASDPLNARNRHSSWQVRSALALSLALAACQVPTGSPISAPASPDASAAAANDCPAIQLVSPQGNPVDLTGTWATGTVEGGNQVIYELRQQGECVWGRAYSAIAGQEPAELFDMVLVGTVQTDFTIDLDLLELSVAEPPDHAYPPFGRASATLGIGFEDADDSELTTLSITNLEARALGCDCGPGFLFQGNGPQVGPVLTLLP
jgi:hypothetical protein